MSKRRELLSKLCISPVIHRGVLTVQTVSETLLDDYDTEIDRFFLLQRMGTLAFRRIKIEKNEEARGQTLLNDADRRFSTTSTPSHRRLIDFARDLWREIQDDHVLDGAAVLAYFFLLAVFPAAIFVLSLLPSLSIPHLQQAILDLLHQVLPEQSANLFEGTVRYVASEGREGLLTFGLIFALWSASTGIYAIMEQLNVVYDVKERRPFWKARGTAILLMVFFVLAGDRIPLAGDLRRSGSVVAGVDHRMEPAITRLLRDSPLDHHWPSRCYWLLP